MMRILLDGQRLPIDVRVTKDLLSTLKSLAKVLNWGVYYDTSREIVYLNTKNSAPFPIPDRQKIDETEMESTRLLGKTICIDPGHGGDDPGAVGPAGTFEKDHTLAIALILRDKLQRNGAKVVLTRDADRSAAHTGNTEQELVARVAIANQAHADLFISIHNDGFPNTANSGTTTYHYGSPEATRLAAAIQKNLVAELGTQDRGNRFASFYVIRYPLMPAVLTEIAFISNPEEEVLLASINGRLNAAEGLFQGIVGYCKV